MFAWLKGLQKQWNRYLVTGNRSVADSYKHLKFALGILGLLLPIVAVVGGLVSPWHEVQISISHTYHTNLRDVLIGLLACVSVVFITHRGYGKFDNIVTTVIGVAAGGVALFPCPININSPANLAVAGFIAEKTGGQPAAVIDAASRLPLGILLVDPLHPASGIVHLISAGLFFFMVALYLYFVLTASNQDQIGKAKRIRNIVYRICGGVIFVTLVSLFIIALAAQDFLAHTHVGLVGETVMLVAFSTAWLIKAGLPGTWHVAAVGAPPATVAKRPAAKKTPRRTGRKKN